MEATQTTHSNKIMVVQIPTLFDQSPNKLFFLSRNPDGKPRKKQHICHIPGCNKVIPKILSKEASKNFASQIYAVLYDTTDIV